MGEPGGAERGGPGLGMAGVDRGIPSSCRGGGEGERGSLAWGRVLGVKGKASSDSIEELGSTAPGVGENGGRGGTGEDGGVELSSVTGLWAESDAT